MHIQISIEASVFPISYLSHLLLGISIDIYLIQEFEFNPECMGVLQKWLLNYVHKKQGKDKKKSSKGLFCADTIHFGDYLVWLLYIFACYAF